MPDYELICQHDPLTAQAEGIAERFGLTLTATPKNSMILRLDEGGLMLINQDEPRVGGINVDFASAQMTWRRHKGGGFQEAVAKAVGVKGNNAPSVVDVTAGLGRDSFILASLGCQITMLERHPMIAAMLDDGLRRASQIDGVDGIIARMTLRFGNGLQELSQWQDSRPDVVYLDPMFPHRKKSAAVKKDMRLFQQLLGTDDDADELLPLSLPLAKRRVVVKRPANAPWLEQRKPDIEQKGKANRFDIYLTHGH